MHSHLVIGKLGGVLQVHLLGPQGAVTGGQGQATEGVTAGTPVPDDGHDLLLDGVGQGNAGGANTHVCAPVNHTLRGTLRGKQEDGSAREQHKSKSESVREGREPGTDLHEHLGATVTLAGSAVHGHGLPVTGELQGEVLLHELLDHLLKDTDREDVVVSLNFMKL